MSRVVRGDSKRRASMESHSALKRDPLEVNNVYLNVNSSTASVDVKNIKDEEIMISKMDSEEAKVVVQMDESYMAPSELTTSTQRVRLRRENQDLKEQIEQI